MDNWYWRYIEALQEEFPFCEIGWYGFCPSVFLRIEQTGGPEMDETDWKRYELAVRGHSGDIPSEHYIFFPSSLDKWVIGDEEKVIELIEKLDEAIGYRYTKD